MIAQTWYYMAMVRSSHSRCGIHVDDAIHAQDIPRLNNGIQEKGIYV